MLDIPYNVRGIQDLNGEWFYGVLTQKQINKLYTPFLAASLQQYINYVSFKVLPHGKGTLDERTTVLKILEILQDEQNSFDAWEREKRSKSN